MRFPSFPALDRIWQRFDDLMRDAEREIDAVMDEVSKMPDADRQEVVTTTTTTNEAGLVVRKTVTRTAVVKVRISGTGEKP